MDINVMVCKAGFGLEIDGAWRFLGGPKSYDSPKTALREPQESPRDPKRAEDANPNIRGVPREPQESPRKRPRTPREPQESESSRNRSLVFRFGSWGCFFAREIPQESQDIHKRALEGSRDPRMRIPSEGLGF